jgi:hypothetical protein
MVWSESRGLEGDGLATGESWSAPVKTLSSLAPTRRASAKDPIRFSGRFWALADRSEEEQSEGEESWDSWEEELGGTSESRDTSRRPPAVATMKGFIARAEELGALSATVVATHHSRWGGRGWRFSLFLLWFSIWEKRTKPRLCGAGVADANGGGRSGAISSREAAKFPATTTAGGGSPRVGDVRPDQAPWALLAAGLGPNSSVGPLASEADSVASLVELG